MPFPLGDDHVFTGRNMNSPDIHPLANGGLVALAWRTVDPNLDPLGDREFVVATWDGLRWTPDPLETAPGVEWPTHLEFGNFSFAPGEPLGMFVGPSHGYWLAKLAQSTLNAPEFREFAYYRKGPSGWTREFETESEWCTPVSPLFDEQISTWNAGKCISG